MKHEVCRPDQEIRPERLCEHPLVGMKRDRLMIRYTEEADLRVLADNMRPADISEVWALNHFTPYEALSHAFNVSKECFSICKQVDNSPVVMFGYTQNDETYGAIWLLGSVEMEDHAVTFLRESKTCLSYIQNKVPLLYNIVDKRNTVHIKWIGWLGFRFLRVINFGPDNLPFIEFARIR